MGLCAALAPGLPRRTQATLQDFSMDGGCFDRLARSLTNARSRRGALVALLGGVLGRRGIAEADAKKGKKPHGGRGTGGGKKTRPPCKKRTQGKCRKKRPDGTACP